jgi:hypothetical protein
VTYSFLITMYGTVTRTLEVNYSSSFCIEVKGGVGILITLWRTRVTDEAVLAEAAHHGLTGFQIRYGSAVQILRRSFI